MNSSIDPRTVKGWGIDADPKNDPTYPMRNRTEVAHEGLSWERGTQQAQDVEVLESNERPGPPTVFGTSTPPAGLSGVIRRAAFKHSEDRYRHWLPLVLADRIGEVEGIVEDLAHGRVPNIPAERGWNAEWQYNRKAFVTNTVAAGLVGFLAYNYLRSARSRR